MPTGSRAHTGRKRNEAARQAILDATVRLFTGGPHEFPTIRAIATEAGVGKQTIYRWWPTKTDLIVEAMAQRAAHLPDTGDHGSLAADLEDFLAFTFATACQPWAGQTMRIIIAEATSNELAMSGLTSYTLERRSIMGRLFARAKSRGEIDESVDVEGLIDQAFGFMWLRMILGHQPLGPAEAKELAGGLVVQAAGRGPISPA
jgi:AcrR family transcriptional regulator